MRIQTQSPLKCVVTGIDGAGKSTTTSKVIDRLQGEYRRIAKPGPSRPVYTVVNEKKTHYYSFLIKVIDFLHGLADKTQSRTLISGVNSLNVVLNGRFAEPTLTRMISPDLIIGARDFYSDPIVYSNFYFPHLAKKPIHKRIDFIRFLTGADFRDVMFFLTVPAEEATERIASRIAQERKNPYSSEREKWNHMHERPDILASLQMAYFDVLHALRERAPHMYVYEIDTSSHTQEEVTDFITETIREHLSGRKNHIQGEWIKVN